jgi:CheY-like chemotaxis protein
MVSSQTVHTVLIVDDDESIQKIFGTLLSDEGHRILEAVDGVEAVDALWHSSDRLVVLLDLMMPRMSGLEVLNLLDTSAELARHSYIIMTASKTKLDANHMALLKRRTIPLMEKTFRLTAVLEAAHTCCEPPRMRDVRGFATDYPMVGAVSPTSTSRIESQTRRDRVPALRCQQVESA